jgi:hypothetical protein
MKSRHRHPSGIVVGICRGRVGATVASHEEQIQLIHLRTYEPPNLHPPGCALSNHR